MKFDIILPSIGRKSLAEAANSVFDQEYQDWHLYIVCDGSTLGIWPRCESMFEKTSIIHLQDRHNDSGAWARNAAIQAGKSEWIAYLDDDDIFLPNHLQILSECANLHPEANMLRTLGRSFSWRHKSPRSSKLVRKVGAVNSQDILTVGMAHTREIFKKTSGWQPVDNHDHILWREMLAAGGVPAVAQDVTFEFER